MAQLRSIAVFAVLLFFASAAFAQLTLVGIKGQVFGCQKPSFNLSKPSGTLTKTLSLTCVDIGSATATANAHLGTPPNNAAALTTTKCGKLTCGTVAEGSAQWIDDVTLFPPSTFKSATAQFHLRDTYIVVITSAGLGTAGACYDLDSVKQCITYRGTTSKTFSVNRAFDVSKNGAGEFQVVIQALLKTTSSGGAKSQIAEPASLGSAYFFTCPTDGWTYTQASNPNNTVVCPVTP
jgi:hypothetical protein